jgi:hypothetical protein
VVADELFFSGQIFEFGPKMGAEAWGFPPWWLVAVCEEGRWRLWY